MKETATQETIEWFSSKKKLTFHLVLRKNVAYQMLCWHAKWDGLDIKAWLTFACFARVQIFLPVVNTLPPLLLHETATIRYENWELHKHKTESQRGFWDHDQLDVYSNWHETNTEWGTKVWCQGSFAYIVMAKVLACHDESCYGEPQEFTWNKRQKMDSKCGPSAFYTGFESVAIVISLYVCSYFLANDFNGFSMAF